MCSVFPFIVHDGDWFRSNRAKAAFLAFSRRSVRSSCVECCAGFGLIHLDRSPSVRLSSDDDAEALVDPKLCPFPENANDVVEAVPPRCAPARPGGLCMEKPEDDGREGSTGASSSIFFGNRQEQHTPMSAHRLT